MKRDTAALFVAALSGLAASSMANMISTDDFGKAFNKPWPAKNGNNRPNNCQQRRAKNKAARKARMKQRLKAKKG